MSNTPSKRNRPLINLLLDAAVLVAFLIATAPRFSGIAIHEWLSIAFGAAIITHLLLHWQWIVGTTKRFFKNTPNMSRVNYTLNILLFIDVTLVIFTGLIISRVALPTLGIPIPRGDPFWSRLHSLTSDLGVIIIGLHLALHWRWVVGVFKRYFVQPFMPRRVTNPALHATQPAELPQ